MDIGICQLLRKPVTKFHSVEKNIQKSCRNLPETRKLGGKQAVLQDLEYTIVARPGARKHSKTKQIDAKFLPETMPKASKNQAT